MVSLTEALAAEREKLEQDSADTHARRRAGREVLSLGANWALPPSCLAAQNAKS